MGLISEYVETGASGSMATYYESLGYEVPRLGFCKGKATVKKGTTITVKVADLKPTSHTLVDINCDGCDKILHVEYINYFKYNRDGMYYCHSCGNKLFRSGKNNSNWNSNKTDEEREIERKYPEYVEFVKRVLARDNYVCQCCNKKSKADMEVHHLNGYNWFIEGRTDDTNGITLCEVCHKNFHSLYGYGNNTKEQYEEWIGYSVGELEKYNGELPTTRKVYCIEENRIYDSSKQIMDAWRLSSVTQIHHVCNHKKGLKSVYGKHLLWLDEYEKMSKEDIEKYLEYCNKNDTYRSVICITTGQVYESTVEANRQNGFPLRSPGITNCCTGKQKSIGELSDGTRLQWMYHDEYLEKVKNGETFEKYENEIFKQVICLTTNEVFDKVVSGAKQYNICENGISTCCSGKQSTAGKLPNGQPLQWMFYDDYLEKINNGEEIKLITSDPCKRKVICITTGEIFDQIKDGAKRYNIKSVGSITNVCKGKHSKTAGRLPDGTPLQWMYYEDYLLKIENNEPIILLDTCAYERKNICVTTGKIFNRLQEGANYYGLKASSSVMKACKENKTAGKLPDGTPLKWMYYDDFLKLPIEEQNEILSRNNESSTDGSFLLDKEAI